MRKVAVAASAVVFIAACSSSHHGPALSTTPGTTPSTLHGAVPTTSAAGGAASPSTTVGISSSHRLGETVTPASGVTVTIFSYAAPVSPSARNAKPAPAGKEYAVIDVQSCAGSVAATSAGPADFVLQLADGTQIGPRLSVQNPGLNTSPLKPRACTRGFVTFAAPAGGRGSLVIYLPSGAAWQVG